MVLSHSLGSLFGIVRLLRFLFNSAANNEMVSGTGLVPRKIVDRWSTNCLFEYGRWRRHWLSGIPVHARRLCLSGWVYRLNLRPPDTQAEQDFIRPPPEQVDRSFLLEANNITARSIEWGRGVLPIRSYWLVVARDVEWCSPVMHMVHEGNKNETSSSVVFTYWNQELFDKPLCKSPHGHHRRRSATAHVQRHLCIGFPLRSTKSPTWTTMEKEANQWP